MAVKCPICESGNVIKKGKRGGGNIIVTAIVFTIFSFGSTNLTKKTN